MMTISNSAYAETRNDQIVVTDRKPHRRYVGLDIAAGVPSGVMLSVAFKPYFQWIHLGVGGGYNGLNGGMRGFLTLDPLHFFPLGVLGQAEIGHYWGGRIPRLDKPLEVSYDFASLMGGIRGGNPNIWSIYGLVGVSWIGAQTNHFDTTISIKDPSISVSNPRMDAVAAPACQLGFRLFF